MQTVPNAAEDQELPAFDENGATVGRESATVTPTTTGTVGGAFYGMTPEYNRPGWAPPVDPERRAQATTDFVLGFAGPTMTMEEAAQGAGPWLRQLGKQEATNAREGLRYALRAANRIPDQGPQDVATRRDLIQAAAGRMGNYHQRLARWLGTEDVLHPGWDKPPEGGVAVEKKSLRERLFGPGKKAAPGPEPSPPKRQSSLAHLAESFTGKSGPERKSLMLKDFAARRELEKLGWKKADVEGLSQARIQDILNRNIENTGQGYKWEVIDRGRTAHEAEARALKGQGTFLDYLRKRGDLEFHRYPLEDIERLDPTEHSARWATQRLREQAWRDPRNPWPPKK